jgi:hypothetical protein
MAIARLLAEMTIVGTRGTANAAKEKTKTIPKIWLLAAL